MEMLGSWLAKGLHMPTRGRGEPKADPFFIDFALKHMRNQKVGSFRDLSHEMRRIILLQ